MTTWISTGKAAKLLGYSRDGFRAKFIGIITSRRVGTGHIRWSKEEVVALISSSVVIM